VVVNPHLGWVYRGLMTWFGAPAKNGKYSHKDGREIIKVGSSTEAHMEYRWPNGEWVKGKV
jgi:hypothetical protein